MWAHAYQFDADTATFIVECSEDTWRRSGFDHDGRGRNDGGLRAHLRGNLGGHRADDQRAPPARLGLAQLQPRCCASAGATRTSCCWAMPRRPRISRSAPARSWRWKARSRWPSICTASRPWRRRSRATRTERRIEVLRLQSAARNSAEWFEHVERYLHLDPVQFNYSLLTRSQRICHENLRQRDPAWLAGAETWFESKRPAAARAARAPMFAPFRLRDIELKTASWCRRWRSTAPSTARRPTGTSSTTPSAPRAAPGWCHRDDLRLAGGPHHAGLHRALRAGARGGLEAHRRFHPRRDRRENRLQLGHSGPKGSTQLGWEEIDAPLEAGNWEVIGAVAGAVVAAQPDPARDDARRHGRGARRSSCAPPRWASAPASTGWSCTARTAICCRRSSRR